MKNKILSLAVISSLFLSTQSAQAQDKYMGEIFWTAATYCPVDTFMAAGQTLQISQYNALYSLLGITFGGDGKQTFALPDLRGRVSLAWGYGPGLSNYTLGQRGGAETTTLTPPAMAAGAALTNGAPVAVAKATANSDPTTNANVPNFAGTGSGAPHENRPPFLALTACIVNVGYYPMRP